ncbi:MAG TPA: hypothetical protein VFT55_10715 [Planctomycetota bacterium]|nr:hypothetical protein [Planctomycetota bacterium]
MIGLARPLGLLLAAALLAAAPLAQAAPKVAPASLPADWRQRDLEGKWVAYRAAVDGNGKDTTIPQAWALALGQSRDFELLEWIAIFEGWRWAGPQLVKADAPQLLRVAVWNVGAPDSHNKDTARKALLDRGDVALGWFEANPAAASGKAAAVFAELVASGVKPAAAAQYLPALDAMQLLVPWLDAPAELAEWGDRKQQEPRVRYVHQVTRALSGVIVHGANDDLVVTKVVALTKHANGVVRTTAFKTLAALPGGCVPVEALHKVAVNGAEDAEHRRIATMALSYSTHPRVMELLAVIAADATHPGCDVAVDRLGEIGDPTTSAMLARIETRDPERLRHIASSISKIQQRQRAAEFLRPVPLRRLLERVAWLRVQKDPAAAAEAKTTAELLRQLAPQGQLGTVLDAFLNLPAPISPFRGEEVERVERELRVYADELRGR